jgi:hypothetical protein
MSLHCGTSHVAIIVIIVPTDISCTASITIIIAAVIISGWGILIEKEM